MNVRYTEGAFQDREHILSYLAARSEAGARNVLKRFDDAARLLSEQPLVGLPTDLDEVRVLFVGRYPYNSSTVFGRILSKSCTSDTRRGCL